MINIIGAGWYGYTAFRVLKAKSLDIHVYDCSKHSKASRYNQNRLHFGYHYPRSLSTRILCEETFERFKNDYPFLLRETNYQHKYYISKGTKDIESIVTVYEDYVKRGYARYCKPIPNTVLGIETQELIVDPVLTQKFFAEELKDNITYTNYPKSLLGYNSTSLDCTYNSFNLFNTPCDKYVYTVIYYTDNYKGPYNITVMDGPFFSLMDGSTSIGKNCLTITHVKYGKFYTSPGIKEVNEAWEKISDDLHNYGIKINQPYYYTISRKHQRENLEDSREVMIQDENNIISVSCSKINGIYEWSNFLNTRF